MARALHSGSSEPRIERWEREAELRGLGLSDEQIEQWWAQQPTDEEGVEVLADNWPIVEVYLRCQWNVVAGAGGAAFLGIPAAEIRAAADALGIPFDGDLLDGIRIMAVAARPLLNKAN